MVIKKSEMSNSTYLLFLNNEALEKYWPLDPKLTENNENLFSFEDQDTTILIDKESGNGSIVTKGPLLRETSEIQLTQCKEVQEN